MRSLSNFLNVLISDIFLILFQSTFNPVFIESKRVHLFDISLHLINIDKRVMSKVHVLLVSLFDRSICRPIYTLTNLFLSSQKKLITLFWPTNLFPTFFSHSLKLGWSKILKNIYLNIKAAIFEYPNLQE